MRYKKIIGYAAALAFVIAALDTASELAKQRQGKAAGSASRPLSINVATPPIPPLAITTTMLPDGKVGENYSSTLAATGGVPPYNWALGAGDALPDGLSLDAAGGVIAGIPTTAQSKTFTITVTDQSGGTPPQPLPDNTLIIAPNPAATAMVGATQLYKALGNVTSNPYVAAWSSSNTTIATVSPASAAETTATCVAAGDADIVAVVAGISNVTPTVLHCVTQGGGGGTSINLSDCSPAALHGGWATMSAGDYTINFPSPCPGTSGTWTSGVNETVSAGVTSVTIRGGTTVNCTGAPGTQGYACPATDGTVIKDAYLSNTQLVVINTGTANARVRITGMTFAGGNIGSTNYVKYNGFLGFSGTTSNLRIDHSHFNHFTYTPQNAASSFQINWSPVYGVADHNLYEAPQQNNHVRLYNGTGVGDREFTQPTNLGGSNFFFVEDSVMNGGFVNDCMGGGKGVFRYNKFIVVGYSGAYQIHGVGQGTQNFRTCRAIEAYHNAFVNTTGSTEFAGGEIGGGVGVDWGNTYTTGYGNAIIYRVLREVAAGHYMTAYPAGPGYCGTGSTGTASPIDQNLDSSGYACYDEVGRGQGDLMSGDWLAPAGGGSGCGKRNDTLASCPATWPRQRLEPWYQWLDSVQAGTKLCSTMWFNGTAPIENRDFFCYNTAFNGTSGVGAGTLAARPANCTTNAAAYPPGNSPGVGYWATDQSTLYVCTAANTWTQYYKPYAYPHPLAAVAVTRPGFEWWAAWWWILALALLVVLYLVREPILRRLRRKEPRA
jgi:hypothetical protein